jgi:hypothetical protein
VSPAEALAEAILFACMADALIRESRHAYHRKHRS